MRALPPFATVRARPACAGQRIRVGPALRRVGGLAVSALDGDREGVSFIGGRRRM
jgi:hypothetical protein